jgi:hypothetical protein
MNTEATYEMLWDCRFCGTKKNLGLTHRCCPNCGAPQDANARYFPPDHERVAVKDHPFVGADLECPSCKNWNGRASKCCGRCGAPLAGREASLRQEVAPVAAFRPPQANKSSAGLIIGLAIGGIAFVIVGLVLVLVFWKRAGSFQVAGHSWERTIAIERFETVRRSAWCDELPAGSRDIGRHKEQRSTKKVPDGQECSKKKKDNGDGTFKEITECKAKFKDEPVMGDKCDFEGQEWKTERTLASRGVSVKDAPAWPKLDLARSGCASLGCEREGKHGEKYSVRFVEAKSQKEATCDVDQARWQSFPDGSSWEGKMGVVSGALDCDSLKRH